MILASGHDIARQYSGDPVFQHLAFEVRAGDRIGLVGPNGAGKSTLLKVLARIDPPDEGSLFIRPGIRVSILRQEPDFDPNLPLIEVARGGLAPLYELQAELEEAARELAEAVSDHERDLASRRYADLRDRIEHQDAFSIDHRIEEVLQGLGFNPRDFHRPAGTFSGGQQSRLMLARLLLESPDLMLLDEPSNHLDIETTAWLENYLARQPVAMVIVSHDRYFLDKVVTSIWELVFHNLQSYPGNYSQYWKLKRERAKVLERQAEKQAEKAADLKDYIAKYAAGQRARQAKDREKKLARLEQDQVDTMRFVEEPVMGFGEVERSGDVAIDARRISKSYAHTLFNDFSLQIERGQRVGILGPNGAGKTTLLNILIGRQKPDSGEVRLGHKIHIGYADQNLESIPPDTTLIRAVRPEDDLAWVDQDTRDLLARFGLTGDQVFQPVKSLSGGERSKAALARLAAQNANLLALDEPTNHLDLWACSALERSLIEFEGTVVVISHDRYFLNQIAHRIIDVRNGQARVYEGNFETYQRLVQADADAQARARDAQTNKQSTHAQKPDQGRGPRRWKFPYRKPDDLEKEIALREAQLHHLETALAAPDTYKDADSARKTQADYESTKSALEQLYAHWEEALERFA
jgi:ATP-binding cassette subfamily F protein 3